LNYNYELGEAFSGVDVSHFTRLMWKSSTHFGAARASITDPQENTLNVTVIIVIYRPAGNIAEEFHQNVIPPNSK
jgi:hypothetical protein